MSVSTAYGLVDPYFYSRNPLSTFANSEDPDEMQHHAAFHQGLDWKGEKSSDKNTIFLKKININPNIFRQL